MEWAGARLLCGLQLMCRRNRPRNLQDRNETISPSPVLQLSPNFLFSAYVDEADHDFQVQRYGAQILYWGEAKAIIFGVERVKKSN